ncbi:hypothetical protein Efla_006918 [Eimeria flavescens]
MWLFSAWKAAAVPAALLSQDLWSMSANDMEGKRREMSEFRGQVLLVTNVASRCGLAAEHMKDFIELKDKYGNEGFEVLAFPTLQFKQQEEKDPQAMCQRYKSLNVNFPVFETTNVNGPDAHPVFQYCKFHSKELYSNGQLQAVGWNYGKFLLDREGRVYGYYGPRTSAAALEGDIQMLLKKEVSGKKRNRDGVLE